MNTSPASGAPRRLFQASALVLALGLSACANFSGIQSQAQLRDATSVGLPAAGSAAPVVAAEWWRELGDPQLDALVARALKDNPSLKLAQARLARAQAVTEVAQASTRPQLGAGVDLTHQRYTENGPVPPPLAGSIRDSGTAQLTASWELDFFGKNRAALDAALGVARAAQADAQAARVLLASQVARTWFQLARLNDQLAVAQRALAQREQTLGLVRDRVNAGLDTRLELRQAEGGLPDTRQQIEALREQASLARNALAALVGQPGVPVAQDPRPLSAIKIEAVAPVLPADLLGRRADITAARWRVEAATRDVDSARAQFYPNINLTAFAGFSSIGLGRLLEAGSQQWGVGPALRLPIFDGGRLRANLRGKTADLDAAIESYNATLVEAVHEVADQLASAGSITRQQAEQRAASEAAEGAYDIAVQRYKAGLGNYLNVLTAESGVLNQRRLAVDLTARALDTRINLMRALGGGYQADAVVASR
ncbi:MAG: efflux transporter outer membrane subunit [Ramlibacter sp.]|nr:efflux transporter outer membrane subunit [Ramlibacter sp.]